MEQLKYAKSAIEPIPEVPAEQNSANVIESLKKRKNSHSRLVISDTAQIHPVLAKSSIRNQNQLTTVTDSQDQSEVAKPAIEGMDLNQE